jgi:hypothetical protein
MKAQSSVTRPLGVFCLFMFKDMLFICTAIMSWIVFESLSHFYVPEWYFVLRSLRMREIKSTSSGRFCITTGRVVWKSILVYFKIRAFWKADCILLFPNKWMYIQQKASWNFLKNLLNVIKRNSFLTVRTADIIYNS